MKARGGGARAGILALLTLLAGGTASAHTRSETHAAWQISGRSVALTFTAPDQEANRLGEGGRPPSDDQLGGYLAAHVGARSSAGPCPASGAWRALASSPGYRRFEFRFLCADERGIEVISTAFFDLVSSHTTFTRIQTTDGTFVEAIMSADKTVLPATKAAISPLADAGFLAFMGHGMMHIFTGVDHMCFLLGLVLISRRLRDLVFVVTGFTIGHSLTLGLAVTGIIRPQPLYIDALVAMTIALIGAENVVVANHRPRLVAGALIVLVVFLAAVKMMGFGTLPSLLLGGAGLFGASYLLLSGELREAARFRIIVTIVFGLIHGFGFAATLLEMQLPPDRLAQLLVGFNLGVEVAQLTVVFAALAIAALIARLTLARIPRALVVDVGSAGLIGIGLYWFVTRCFA